MLSLSTGFWFESEFRPPYPEKKNHLSFVNISPTLVIDTSMEKSSRVLGTAWKPRNEFFSKKFEID